MIGRNRIGRRLPAAHASTELGPQPERLEQAQLEQDAKARRRPDASEQREALARQGEQMARLLPLERFRRQAVEQLGEKARERITCGITAKPEMRIDEARSLEEAHAAARAGAAFDREMVE